jgi:Glycosyltransferase family 87
MPINKPQSQVVWLAWIVLVLSFSIMVVRAKIIERNLEHSKDFTPIITGTYCFYSGCDPYDWSESKHQFAAHGGDPSLIPWEEEWPMYPPSLYFVTTPLAVLSAPAAASVWFVVSAASLLVAVFLLAGLCSGYNDGLAQMLASLVLLTSPSLLALGQTSTLAISFLVIGVCLLLDSRHRKLAAVCFTISLALKAQLGLPVLVYFLVDRTYRRWAAPVGIAWAFLVIIGAGWITFATQSFDWYGSLQENLAATTGPGAINDPSALNELGAESMLNLQALFAVFSGSSRFYNRGTLITTGVIGLFWLAASYRMNPSTFKHYLGIGSAICLGLIGAYHRFYDHASLLLIIPALALLLAKTQKIGIAIALISLQALAYFHGAFIPAFAESKLHLPVSSNNFLTILLLRRQALFLFLTCCLMVAYYFVVSGKTTAAKRLTEQATAKV